MIFILRVQKKIHGGLVNTCLLLLLARPGVVPPGGHILTELPQHGPPSSGETFHSSLHTSSRLLVLLNNTVRRNSALNSLK